MPQARKLLRINVFSETFLPEAYLHDFDSCTKSERESSSIPETTFMGERQEKYKTEEGKNGHVVYVEIQGLKE